MGTILDDLGGVKITASGHTHSRHMPKKIPSLLLQTDENNEVLGERQ